MGFSNAILAFSTSASTNPLPHEQLPTPTTPVMPSSPSAVTKLSLNPFVHTVDLANLCVMPSGPLPPNPPELLDSKAMQRLFTALNNGGVEVVIFDAPPLLGLSDASILASKVDGTLVVADMTRADKRQLKEMKAILSQVGAHVLGCVVNKQHRNRKDMIYSYYYGTNEQKGKRSRGKKDASLTSISPVTPGILKQSKTQPQQDFLDSAVKLAPFHHIEVDTESQPDIASGDTVKLTSVYPIQPETQSRRDLLDGRKGG